MWGRPGDHARGLRPAGWGPAAALSQCPAPPAPSAVPMGQAGCHCWVVLGVFCPFAPTQLPRTVPRPPLSSGRTAARSSEGVRSGSGRRPQCAHGRGRKAQRKPQSSALSVGPTTRPQDCGAAGGQAGKPRSPAPRGCLKGGALTLPPPYPGADVPPSSAAPTGILTMGLPPQPGPQQVAGERVPLPASVPLRVPLQPPTAQEPRRPGPGQLLG